MSSDDYHEECIPYHTTKQHLFTYLGGDTPSASGWLFNDGDDKPITIEAFINTLYETYDDDLFDLLEKCEKGTLSAEETEDIRESMESMGECGNLMTRAHIAKEDHLEQSIENLKRDLQKYCDGEDDEDKFCVDGVAEHYLYFKYGEYYFFWFGMDSFSRYINYHEECIPYHTTHKHLFTYLGSYQSCTTGWLCLENQDNCPITIESFINTMFERCGSQVFDILDKCENGTLSSHERFILEEGMPSTGSGNDNGIMWRDVCKENQLDCLLERVKMMLETLSDVRMAQTGVPLKRIPDILKRYAYFKYGQYYFFWFGMADYELKSFNDYSKLQLSKQLDIPLNSNDHQQLGGANLEDNSLEGDDENDEQ